MIPLENIGSIIDIKNNVEWTSSKINIEVFLLLYVIQKKYHHIYIYIHYYVINLKYLLVI